MAVNVKMGVDIGSFTQGIKQGQQILKGLNAEMKTADAEFKATGNAEKMMADKTKTLNSQLNVQKGIVDKTKKALQEMDKAGIDPADKDYQKLYATLMNAQTGMYEAQAALNALGTSAQEAAGGADQLTKSVNSIGKKISLDQVITGIGKITGGLENAAKKAISLGETIWDSIMDAAKWADDTQTMAQMYGIDLDTFQRMQKLVVNGMDTSVEDMLKAQSKLKKGIGSESKEVQETLQALGLVMTRTIDTGFGQVQQTTLKTTDSMELFWEAGQKILALKDENKQEDMAQTLFGKGWKELRSLFDSYKTVEEYKKALEEVSVNSKESISNLTTLNETVGEVKGNLQTLTVEVLGQLAPTLTKLADSLNGVLESIIEYLNTPEGQEMLSSLGETVGSLFEDLGNIDPKSVVENFTTVFNGLVDGLKWIVNNKDTVVKALEGVVIGWAGLKLAGGALDILKLISGLKGLGNGNANGGNVVTEGEPGQSGTVGTTTQTHPIIEKLVNGMAVKSVMDQAFQIFDDAMAASNGATTAREWEIGMQRQKLMRGEISQEEYENQESRINDLYDKLDEIIAEKGPVEIPATLVVMGVSAGGSMGTTNNGWFSGGGGGGPLRYIKSADGFANGINYVPYDGMLARLHKGERVVPAREVASRNFSSNLYVENMNMNGGLSADALAASIASRNRRVMAGYGS